MSDKQKKFVPSPGYVIAVNRTEFAIRQVAGALDIFPTVLGDALRKAGFTLEPDAFDLVADAIMTIEARDRMANSGLKVVQDPVQEETNDE